MVEHVIVAWKCTSFVLLNPPNENVQIIVSVVKQCKSLRKLHIDKRRMNWNLGEDGLLLKANCSQPTGKSPKLIKGGVSIFFPQLGTSGASQKQGSSRSKLWSLNNCPLHLVPTGMSI